MKLENGKIRKLKNLSFPLIWGDVKTILATSGPKKFIFIFLIHF